MDCPKCKAPGMCVCEPEPFPAPARNDGGEPCGECHLKPGETCDICGAVSRTPTAADDRADPERARPASEWTEEMGDVVWWRFPVEEAPWIGSPLSLGYTFEVHTQDDIEPRVAARGQIGGWKEGYYTHFTPLPAVPKIGTDFAEAPSGPRAE